MKDSGVEWIGEIPEEWNIRKLNGLLQSIGSGTTPKSNPNYYDGEYAWLNTGDLTDDLIQNVNKTVTKLAIQDHSALRIYDAPSVVIALYGATIGKLGITTYPLTVNQACCVMTTMPDLNYKYLFYALLSIRKYLLTLSYGAGQPNISGETIKSLRISHPPLLTQNRIASFLDTKSSLIDAAVQKEREVIDKLKEYRQAVITEAVTKGIRPGVPMKESGVEWIGEIPKHWIISRFSFETWVRARLGWKGLKADEYVDAGYIFLSTPNLKEEKIDFENVNYINQFRYDESPEIKLTVGDVLLAKDGSTLGTVNVVRNLPNEATVNGSIAVITPKNNVNSVYLMYLIKSSYIQNIIRCLKDGSGVPHLFQRDINKIYITRPPLPEQQEIADYLEAKCSEIDATIQKRELAIEKLTAYKQSLIYECVTGKKEVLG